MTLKKFRHYHLCQILDGFDFSLPLDLHVAKYFKAHKALGSKDRGEIAENLFDIMRHYKLFCTLSPKKDGSDWIEAKQKGLPPFDPSHVVPPIIFDLLVNDYGKEQALAIAQSFASRAPTMVRVNLAKISREELFNRWKDLFPVKLSLNSPLGIEFSQKTSFFSMEEFKQGFFEIQDEASQQVALLVDPKPGDLVLDYCSGSGGKSLAFAPLMQGKGQIFLHDVRKKALLEAKKRLARAGVQNAQWKDAFDPTLCLLHGKMHKVLVDAPCSGSGTWRRNPDQKWKFCIEDLNELVQKQRDIFEKALLFLGKHGKIIYATCSLFSRENEEQVAYFCEKFGLKCVAPPFKKIPKDGECDGFFAAILQRCS